MRKRKELDSNLLNKKNAPSEVFNQDHYMMEDLKQENYNLKQKIDRLQKALADSNIYSSLTSRSFVVKCSFACYLPHFPSL